MQLPADYFDKLAHSYDEDFSDRLAGSWLRQFVHDRLGPITPPGTRVLEIGCGTGVDALAFAARQCAVIATDASSNMLSLTQRKVDQAALGPQIRCLRWDLNLPLPDEISSIAPQDLVFSNFGAFNCVHRTRELAATLATRLKTGAHLALVVMGPYCPWEMIWYALRGSRSLATRRLRRPTASEPGLTVDYPAATELTRLFANHFECVSVTGVGVFMPPSFAFHLVDAHPQLFGKLMSLDRRIADAWPFYHLGDHYLAIYRKRCPTSVVIGL